VCPEARTRTSSPPATAVRCEIVCFGQSASISAADESHRRIDRVPSVVIDGGDVLLERQQKVTSALLTSLVDRI
jgi:hypothetical protein